MLILVNKMCSEPFPSTGKPSSPLLNSISFQ